MPRCRAPHAVTLLQTEGAVTCYRCYGDYPLLFVDPRCGGDYTRANRCRLLMLAVPLTVPRVNEHHLCRYCGGGMTPVAVGNTVALLPGALLQIAVVIAVVAFCLRVVLPCRACLVITLPADRYLDACCR